MDLFKDAVVLKGIVLKGIVLKGIVLKGIVLTKLNDKERCCEEGMDE